jgi:hypothetical protein
MGWLVACSRGALMVSGQSCEGGGQKTSSSASLADGTVMPSNHLLQERRLLPVLLQAATSGPAAVQRPAAEGVANVCADPLLVAGTLEEHGGLAALVAMALSPDQEVQVSRSPCDLLHGALGSQLLLWCSQASWRFCICALPLRLECELVALDIRTKTC